MDIRPNTIIIQPPLTAMLHKFISSGADIGVNTGLAPAIESVSAGATWANNNIAFISEDSFYIPEWYVPVPDTMHHKSVHAR